MSKPLPKSNSSVEKYIYGMQFMQLPSEIIELRRVVINSVEFNTELEFKKTLSNLTFHS
jgi:hypothetical protein